MPRTPLARVVPTKCRFDKEGVLPVFFDATGKVIPTDIVEPKIAEKLLSQCKQHKVVKTGKGAVVKKSSRDIYISSGSSSPGAKAKKYSCTRTDKGIEYYDTEGDYVNSTFISPEVKKLISNCKDARKAIEKPHETGKTRSGMKYQCDGKTVSAKDAAVAENKGKKCSPVK